MLSVSSLPIDDNQKHWRQSTCRSCSSYYTKILSRKDPIKETPSDLIIFFLKIQLKGKKKKVCLNIVDFLLWLKLQEYNRKASIICCENELQSLGGWDGSTPEQLSAQIQRLTQRLQRESQRYGKYNLISTCCNSLAQAFGIYLQFSFVFLL